MARRAGCLNPDLKLKGDNAKLVGYVENMFSNIIMIIFVIKNKSTFFFLALFIIIKRRY